jgi:TonB family protein
VYARYLLPPLPHTARQSGHESLQWVEPTEFPSVLPGVPSLARVAARLRGHIGQGAPPPVSSASMLEVAEFATPRRVYVESELDRPVVRDPSSAAPEYPAALEKARVEGIVTVSFVVDTLGFADSTSLQIINVSNIDFGESVRRALPLMRFAPAELSGHHVPERVYQQFKFVLPPQTAANARSTDSSKTVNAR